MVQYQEELTGLDTDIYGAYFLTLSIELSLVQSAVYITTTDKKVISHPKFSHQLIGSQMAQPQMHMVIFYKTS